MNKEYRSIGDIMIEHPAEDAAVESRHVEGYALVFDSESNYMGMYETIQRGAITEDTLRNSDVFACFDHDMKRVLARSNKGEGTLQLSVDDHGLKYAFDAPNTELGNELLEYLKRGDINKSSFGFCVNKEDPESQTFEMRNGILYRTIKKIHSLFDVSPVWQPAYEATEIAKRDAESMKEEAIKQLKESISKQLDEKMSEVEALANEDK